MPTKAERIAELKAEIARLEAERRPQARLEPEVDTWYWHVCYGKVYNSCSSGSEVDYDRMRSGNVFKTAEESQAYAEHIEAVTACNDAAMQSWVDAGEVLDWVDDEQKKCEIIFDHEAQTFVVVDTYDVQFSALHPFATKAAAQVFLHTYDKTHRLFWQYGDV